MTVKFFAYYRDPEFAGCKELQWPAAADVWELGNQLSAQFGPKFRAEFFSPDGSDAGERTILLVNGRRIDFLNGIHTALRDSDVIQVFPVVAGG